MKQRFLSLLLAALTVALTLGCLTAIPVFAEPSADEMPVMTPYHGQPFRPDGVTYGQVSFLVPSADGVTHDAWDGNIDHNTDLILLTYVKDGVTYVDRTVRQIQAELGKLALVRTCYTYENGTDGQTRLNLVFHFDDHDVLKPEDVVAVTVKKGFVWCAGSPNGIEKELSALTLDRDVTFMTQGGTPGITAVQAGSMAGSTQVGALRIRFDRKDSESLKAISAVNLCASAIPGKTLGDLVTINGVSVTQLVQEGKVARLCFYGDLLVFHIDDPNYLAALKSEEYEIVINPGFRWMNWHQDDWGNWGGTNCDKYTPVKDTLVTSPIAFRVNQKDEVVVDTAGISIEPGYKSTYFVGERIDMTSLLIRIHYPGREGAVMPILESMVSYDFSRAGEATVTVTVLDMTATYTVTVLEDPDATEPPTEPVTEPATVPDTPTDTEAVTLPVTDAATDTPDQEGGCASVLAVLSLPAILSVAAVALCKRRGDN